MDNLPIDEPEANCAYCGEPLMINIGHQMTDIICENEDCGLTSACIVQTDIEKIVNFVKPKIDKNKRCVWEYYDQDDTLLIECPHKTGSQDFDNFIGERWKYCPYCGYQIDIVYRNDDPIQEDDEKLKYGEVQFCMVDGVEDAYISEVYGNFPIDILQNIQREFRESGITIKKDTLFVICKPIPVSEKQYNSENESLTFIGFQFEKIREIAYLDVGDGDHDHDDRML
jgi:hypothetical protein